MRVLGIIGFFLWTLLKILLLILLAVLILLLIVLCCSIRYEATGRAEGENFGDGLEAHVKVTALLGLAALRGILRGGDFLYSFRIAGKTIRKGRRQKAAAGGQEETGPESSETNSEGEEISGPEESSERERTSEGEELSEREEIAGREVSSEVKGFSGREESPEGTEFSEPESFSEREKKPKKQKLFGKRKKRKHGEAPEAAKPPEKEKSLSEKISSGREKAERVWEKLQEPSFRKTLRRVKRAAGKILRHILPQVLRGKAVAGTGDPALTGQLIGLFYACWPLYGENWDLELSGDFEKKRLQGKVYMKGRIRPLTIIGIVLSLLPDKNILRMIWSRLKRKKG